MPEGILHCSPFVRHAQTERTSPRIEGQGDGDQTGSHPLRFADRGSLAARANRALHLAPYECLLRFGKLGVGGVSGVPL